MSNKQILVYGVLGSTNDLRSVFLGHINFKKLMKFRKFNEIFHCCMTRLRNTNLSVFTQCQYRRNILRNKNIGQSRFKKHSKFQNFNEIFHFGMARLRNTSLDVFIQCQHTRTTLTKKNMRQSLFKKHSKFHNYDEIFYCGRTRLRNRNTTTRGCLWVVAVKKWLVVCDRGWWR